MSTDADLKGRFDRLASPQDDLDWLDVVRRARELHSSPRGRRRRALLIAAALVMLLALAGAAVALTGTTTGVPAIDRLLDRGSPVDADPGEPRPVLRPRQGSVSEPLEFTVGGTPYTAVGFRNHRDGMCSALVDSSGVGPQQDGGVSCLSARLLRRALAERPVEFFAGGGGRYLKLAGFARADVERIVVTGPTRQTTAKLSPPWSPEPWKGAPIRFVYVLFDAPAGGPRPGQLIGNDLHIEAHLANGRIVEVRR
jgi:hypothetical protein